MVAFSPAPLLKPQTGPDVVSTMEGPRGPGRVAGKIALVTGGTQGLGYSVASLLALEGAHVIVADLGDAAGDTAVRSIRKNSGNASFSRLDVRDEEQWVALIDDITQSYGSLDVLVNNAGVSLQRNVVDTTLDEWRHVLSTNLEGTFLGLKHGIGAIARSGGGSIINLSSVDGIVASPDLAAYCASKGGVRLLSKSAALYCGSVRNGVRVNSVHPSFILGPLTDTYLRGQDDPEAAMHAMEQAHPIGRLGQPADVAYGVLYLASDEASWVTGSELVIDGGWTAA
ncbi:glucose 1-dehydrogenase [Nocardioides sp. CN2-186]|uniref:glucose 1-dehydrogenase n=1 Tax=Nocardioides tweenelious TaxID=3156607 RepID=UPI0032B5D31D